MKEILDNFEKKQVEVDPNKLLLHIWKHPLATFRYLLINTPNKYVVVFFALSGTINSLDQAIFKELGFTYSISTILICAIVLGSTFGIITNYLYCWTLYITGKWLKGTAIASEFRTVLAWSFVPMITSSLLLIPQFILFGAKVFHPSFIVEETDLVIYSGFLIIEFTLTIWSLVLLVKGTALIQSFSIGKAIFNLILPVLLLTILILGTALTLDQFTLISN